MSSRTVVSPGRALSRAGASGARLQAGSAATNRKAPAIEAARRGRGRIIIVRSNLAPSGRTGNPGPAGVPQEVALQRRILAVDVDRLPKIALGYRRQHPRDVGGVSGHVIEELIDPADV